MDRAKDDHATDSKGAVTISHREKIVDDREADAGVQQQKFYDADMQNININLMQSMQMNRRLHQSGDEDAKKVHHIQMNRRLHQSDDADDFSEHHHPHPLYSRCVSVDGSSSGGSGNEKMRYHGRKSDSPPIRSPSYVQHRQYRSSVHRSMDVLHSTIETIDNNKENTVPTATSASPDIRLDSPKFALAQQNSPNTPLSCYKSPPSTHSSPMYTAHEAHTDCNVFTYSPLITEPFKHSTYFHFPDVDHMPTPSTLPTTMTTKDDNSNLLNNMNTLQIEDDSPKVGIGGSTRKTKKEAIRRARLKSISLDSDGARLVEENLCIPVEELVERTLPQTGAFTSEHGQSLDGSFEELDEQTTVTNRTPIAYESSSMENNQLVLDLKFRDETRSMNRMDDDATTTKLHTPKTPTLTQARQKAISFDSAQKSIIREKRSHLSSASSDNCHQPMLRAKPLHHCLQVETKASISVPTTPKRQHHGKTCKPLGGTVSSSKSAKKLTCGVNFNLAAPSHGASAGLGIVKKSNSGIDRKSMIDEDTSAAYVSLPMQSNANLRTLPEKTIICDFTLNATDRASIEANFEDYYDETYGGESDDASYMAADDIECDIIGGSVNSLISGSNLSSNNVGTGSNGNGNGTGSRSSRNQNVLSLSNYSLSNFQGSHCSLARSNYNLCGVSSGGNSTIGPSAANQSAFVNTAVGTAGNCMHGTQADQSSETSAFPMFPISTSRSSINCCGKKNLLQRRGSNTSLTLNIVSGGNLSAAKKGLLERRNSNASLTLNIQKRALSTSNCYLQHSEEQQTCTMCGGGGFIKKLEQQDVSYGDKTMRTKTTRSTHRRKFLSSENLNVHHPFSLCQLPIKTSSVFDLNQTSGEMLHHVADYDDDEDDDDDDGNKFTYCPCTNNIIRNITTKPLSPQTTSEDFKIYLANIQILQNASNLLTEHKLNVLGHVFNRGYAENPTQSASSADTSTTNESNANRMESAASAIIRASVAQLPSEKEQNCLLTNLHKEFWELPTNYQEKPLIFGSHAKNRYKTILPNEHSRVILDSEFDDDDAEEARGCHPQEQSTFELYINANYIKGPDYTQNAYIATQGPMSNTIYDFWLMVYQNIKKSSNFNAANSRNDDGAGGGGMVGQQKIVMLTDIIENDESKCAIYFPQIVGKVSCFLNQYGRCQKDFQAILERLEAHFNRADVWPIEIPTVKICDLDRSQVPDDIDYSYFCVKNVGVSNRKGYTMRKFHCIYHLNKRPSDLPLGAAPNDSEATTTNRGVRDKCSDRKTYQFIAYHYWFPHWPDHRSPENIDVVLDMCIDLLDSDCDLYFQTDSEQYDVATEHHTVDKSILTTDMQKSVSAAPIPIIHCSAGIGRTGCVAAILNGIRQMRTSYLTATSKSGTMGHVSVDVLGIVSNLRLQRGGMVQNSEQYELIHRALCLYHHRLFSN